MAWNPVVTWSPKLESSQTTWKPVVTAQDATFPVVTTLSRRSRPSHAAANTRGPTETSTDLHAAHAVNAAAHPN